MSAKAITAAASSAARAGAEPTLATDATQSTPAHMTQSRPSGARGPRSAGIPARGPVRGRMRHVIAAATTMRGTIAQNAPRQTPSPAKTPPTAGPDRAARPHAPGDRRQHPRPQELREHLAHDPVHGGRHHAAAQPLQTAAADEDRHAGRERAHAGAGDQDGGGGEQRGACPRPAHHHGAARAAEDGGDGVGGRRPRIEREAADVRHDRRKHRGRDEKAERRGHRAQDDGDGGLRVRVREQRAPRDRRRASGGGGEPSLFPLAHRSKVGGGEAAVKRRGSPPSRLSRSARAPR